ncbi:uncharacterized protein C14orf28 homolog [Actinia tenebrosa]|uniref:Uncharacterized protein C14orf28 homolog n=1 Tax=Actinia tenebrosa TaxID=6105 RepID=A0A6P8HAC1_ACTTE|nr:uncharacterized protein C14orf28 homolog [Actinia tenebrosa]
MSYFVLLVKDTKKFNGSPPTGAPVYRMEDVSTEDSTTSSNVYCDGARTTYPRVFPDGMPLIIPVDVELLAAQGVRLRMKNIPADMTILDHKYELQAVTLRSGKYEHYTCIFKYNSNWLYYDGLCNEGKPSLFTNFPHTYRPNTLLYVKISE